LATTTGMAGQTLRSSVPNSSLHDTSTVGDYAELLFNGTKITLLLTKDFNPGSIDVYVDGVKIDTINGYFASLLWQQTYTSPAPSVGNHVVRLVYASDGTYVDAEAITILP